MKSFIRQLISYAQNNHPLLSRQYVPDDVQGSCFLLIHDASGTPSGTHFLYSYPTE